MTYAVSFAPHAHGQLVSLYDYIADKSSAHVAGRFVDSIVLFCENLKNYPRRGTRRDDLYPGLRTVGFKRRVTIAFLIDDKSHTVTILGVYYGGQDFEARMRSS